MENCGLHRFPTLQGCTDTARRPTQPPARQSSHSQRPRSVSQSAMAFVRKPIETEIRSNPHSYLESSTKMHAVRVMATPDSRIHSDPAWGMGTERQRPRPGATNAWKMDQPREGVRSRSHPPSAPPLVATCCLEAMPPAAPHAARRPRAGRFARCRLVRSTPTSPTPTSTGLQYGVPRRARPTT